MVTRNEAIRVLHVVGGMDAGGIETWLLNVLRQIDRKSYQFDFLTHTEKACFYDNEVRSLGSSIFPCLAPSRPWLYTANFLRVLREHGPYDIVHSHVHHFSGLTLMLALHAGVPVRIAHSHNDTVRPDRIAGRIRRSYLNAATRGIESFATIKLACGHQAASSLFGSEYRVLHYGIDLAPFSLPVDAREIRRSLQIPEGAIVVGHVGRFEKQKNHESLIDIFAEMYRREPRSFLLLLGQGSLRGKIESLVVKRNLSHRVRFAGLRSDVAVVMRGGMDCFVFPSHHEGLAIVLLEAQAAGLPCIVSETLTNEGRVVPWLWHKLAPPEPEVWAVQALEAIEKRADRAMAVREFAKSTFALSQSVGALSRIYSDSMGVRAGEPFECRAQ